MAVRGRALAPGHLLGGEVMTRSHRRWHLYLWLLVGPLVALGFVLALVLRREALP